MLTIWDALGVAPTGDRREIRKAYARRLKLYHPEDDPEGFQALREAYELALEYSDSRAPRPPNVSPTRAASEVSTPTDSADVIGALMDSVRAIYRDDEMRVSTEAWTALLKEDALWSVDARERFQAELFAFLTRFQKDPGDPVWQLLEEEFQFRSHAPFLYRRFRDPYEVDRVLDRIHRAFPAPGRLPDRHVTLPGGRELFESSLPESSRDDLLEKPVPLLDAFFGWIVEHFFDITGGRKLELSWGLVLLALAVSARFWLPLLPDGRAAATPTIVDSDSREFLEAHAGVHPESARRLAERYWDEEPRNTERAAFWYESAALRGDVEAQKRLGDAYRDGWAGKRNPGEAAKWYRLAAEKGHPLALVALGLAYYRGEGVEKDDAEAFRWISRAAARDVPEAQVVLGSLYELGHGVPANPSYAARLYREAATTLPWAQLQLGRLYATGVGVERNDVEAFFWLSLASRDETLVATVRPRLHALRSALTNEELSAVKQRIASRDAGARKQR